MEEPHLGYGLHIRGRRPINQRWTGFNILTRGDVTLLQDNIGYLRTINAPATQMSTVNKVLNHSLAIMQCLEQLSKMVCVLDQAPYAKAVEIIWKHSENKMSPRCGHIKLLITTTKLPLSNGVNTKICATGIDNFFFLIVRLCPRANDSLRDPLVLPC